MKEAGRATRSLVLDFSWWFNAGRWAHGKAPGSGTWLSSCTTSTATGSGRALSTSDGHPLRCRHRSHDGSVLGKIEETEHITTTTIRLVVPAGQVTDPRRADCWRGDPASHAGATHPA